MSLFHRDRLLQTIVMTTCFQTDIVAISLLSLLPTLCQQEQGSTSWPHPQHYLLSPLHLTRNVNPQLIQH